MRKAPDHILRARARRRKEENEAVERIEARLQKRVDEIRETILRASEKTSEKLSFSEAKEAREMEFKRLEELKNARKSLGSMIIPGKKKRRKKNGGVDD